MNGSDLAADGSPLLKNSSDQQGYYKLDLGHWGIGYRIDYTDAFRIVNQQAFNISLIYLNFTDESDGNCYMWLWVQNGSQWACAWNSTHSLLNATQRISLPANETLRVWVRVNLEIPTREAYEDVGEGDNERTVFFLRESNIVEDSLAIYTDPYFPVGYTVDHQDGIITFAEPPPENCDIDASYRYRPHALYQDQPVIPFAGTIHLYFTSA
ncbi:MAG: hypothetical protein HWN68_18860 [Desulfobacterales bacterium]|nr:hypothetical protein [Desulfobacterales bacterium]